ncbi:MAG: GatB/YqeY domain-containing protein [Chloroflexi bacterium]|nr:GatB/YqeY domain-containing protein [Chloroflexota bacterium]
MSLKEKLAEDLKDAIRQGDESRKTAIRMVTWAVKNAEVAAGKPLEDPEVLVVIAKQVKQGRESIEEFKKGRRQDLVDKEAAEMRVLEAYLPPAMATEEIAEEARKVIAEVGARGPADKGKVMPVLIARLAGRAEGRVINEVVTELLAAPSP